jgi:hypothetical protein
MYTSHWTLSYPILLPTAYSPALICFGRWRGWWITCNYPTVLKEKNMEKQEEYNLRYLLAKFRTTWEKASDRLRQRAKKKNKNPVGRLPTSEQNWKIILSDEVRCRIGKGETSRFRLCLLTQRDVRAISITICCINKHRKQPLVHSSITNLVTQTFLPIQIPLSFTFTPRSSAVSVWQLVVSPGSCTKQYYQKGRFMLRLAFKQNQTPETFDRNRAPQWEFRSYWCTDVFRQGLQIWRSRILAS